MAPIFRRVMMLCAFVHIFALRMIFAATFTVTKTTDNGVSGELRWAIQQSNKTRGTNTIAFNIAGSGPFTIQPKKDLDAITNPVIINGFSQPRATANTLASGNNANLLIVLSGNNYTEGNASTGTGNGLTFARGSSGSVVKGLIITSWINNGIVINGANSVSILGNFIGTNVQGTAQVANQTGIFVASATNTVIGSPNVADRNSIAGSFFFFNNSACIVLDQANGTIIQNNYIGTDKTGTQILGNSLVGVLCNSLSTMTIGGASSTMRNIISGHTLAGIALQGITNSLIQNNYIGTDVTGAHALGNLNMGIVVNGTGASASTSGNMISNNLISGNRVGIKLGLASLPGTNQNTIQGNLIGTDVTGTKQLSNAYGIIINDDANTVGGQNTNARNIISGNTVGGVLLYGAVSNNTVTGNYIGTNITNSQALSNGYGVQEGLSAGLVGSNTVSNNTFGGGNTVSLVCS